MMEVEVATIPKSAVNVLEGPALVDGKSVARTVGNAHEAWIEIWADDAWVENSSVSIIDVTNGLALSPDELAERGITGAVKLEKK